MKQLVLIIIVSMTVNAQPFLKSSLIGFVYDQATGEPIVNATVLVCKNTGTFHDSKEIIAKTKTDEDGYFKVSVLDASRLFRLFKENDEGCRRWVLRATVSTLQLFPDC